ncbi:hypothetical protein EYF80_058569 [Liparis tanakae]|uniref:Uncharacterized protein n=1 Tax=Liparis tanakae TaxID=230148 RepID=A0A4Z2ERR6_9TELE|nr:hypothetical protein EYF80_058569 [Liparis tanakae]
MRAGLMRGGVMCPSVRSVPCGTRMFRVWIQGKKVHGVPLELLLGPQTVQCGPGAPPGATDGTVWPWSSSWGHRRYSVALELLQGHRRYSVALELLGPHKMNL